MKAADVGAQVAVVVPKSGGRYNAVMAKALEAAFTLGLTTAMFWVGSKILQSVVNPPAPGAVQARKRIAGMLGVPPSRLILNPYEATLTTCVFDPQRLGVSMADVAGLDALLDTLTQDVRFMRAFPAAGGSSMLAASKGLLLYGPPGTGKTMVAKAFAAHVGAVLINVTASTVLSKWLGDSNKLVQAIFTLADKISRCGRTVVVFVDEVDALLGDAVGAESQHGMQIQTEFMQLWDGLVATKGVLVVGATNRPNRLNDAMWRRFGTHFEVPLPNEDARYQILLTKLRRLEGELRASEAHEPASTPSIVPVLLRRQAPTRPPAATAAPGQTPQVPSEWLTAGCRTTLRRHQLAPDENVEYRSEDVDLATRVLDAPMHPLRRAAKLTDKYNGSDLVEVVKRAARRRWHAANASGGAAAGGRFLTEQDLLLAISEVKPAAKTSRRDETRQGAEASALNLLNTPMGLSGDVALLLPELLRTLAQQRATDSADRQD